MGADARGTRWLAFAFVQLAVSNADRGGTSYLQNCSFDHKGVHFVRCDWRTRYRSGGIESEQADLHDSPGGTWRWFQDDGRACAKPRAENIVMVTHHPWHDAADDGGFEVYVSDATHVLDLDPEQARSA